MNLQKTIVVLTTIGTILLCAGVAIAAAVTDAAEYHKADRLANMLRRLHDQDGGVR
ncbi:hypothetical protein [Bifidobacterium samirii]|uniref:Uncharacterized protein n=1 Tax=Bifidobacterium samirii TaxID=2306974 RepID=A0A430FUA6_9BIFI|nr:hypothetical protein [Bifidobacterium samirii]RSX56739.1 hypothetical protein D2E24_1029 [Bifidobacterium samirii]